MQRKINAKDIKSFRGAGFFSIFSFYHQIHFHGYWLIPLYKNELQDDEKKIYKGLEGEKGG